MGYSSAAMWIAPAKITKAYFLNKCPHSMNATPRPSQTGLSPSSVLCLLSVVSALAERRSTNAERVKRAVY